MTDNKSALDALRRIYDKAYLSTTSTLSEEALKGDFERVKAAITAPPAPTVIGDDVVMKPICYDCAEGKDVVYDHMPESGICGCGKKLLTDRKIRAATQPPTDAQRQAALDSIDRIHVWMLGRTIYPNVTQDIYTIKSALQSPAVPMDDIKIRAEWIIASDDKSQMRLIAHEILALLGGKEG